MINALNQIEKLLNEEISSINQKINGTIFLDILKVAIQLIDILGITFLVILSKLIDIFSDSNCNDFGLNE